MNFHFCINSHIVWSQIESLLISFICRVMLTRKIITEILAQLLNIWKAFIFLQENLEPNLSENIKWSQDSAIQCWQKAQDHYVRGLYSALAIKALDDLLTFAQMCWQLLTTVSTILSNHMHQKLTKHRYG